MNTVPLVFACAFAVGLRFQFPSPLLTHPCVTSSTWIPAQTFSGKGGGAAACEPGDQPAAEAHTPARTRELYLEPGETIVFPGNTFAIRRIVVMLSSGAELAILREVWAESIQTLDESWRWHKGVGFYCVHERCREEVHVSRLI